MNCKNYEELDGVDIDWKRDAKILSQSQEDEYVKDERLYGIKKGEEKTEDGLPVQKLKRAKGEYRDVD